MENKERYVNVLIYAELCDVTPRAIRGRIQRGLIRTIPNNGKTPYYGRLIDTKKYPPKPELKRGRKGYGNLKSDE